MAAGAAREAAAAAVRERVAVGAVMDLRLAVAGTAAAVTVDAVGATGELAAARSGPRRRRRHESA